MKDFYGENGFVAMKENLLFDYTRENYFHSAMYYHLSDLVQQWHSSSILSSDRLCFYSAFQVHVVFLSSLFGVLFDFFDDGCFYGVFSDNYGWLIKFDI